MPLKILESLFKINKFLKLISQTHPIFSNLFLEERKKKKRKRRLKVSNLSYPQPEKESLSRDRESTIYFHPDSQATINYRSNPRSISSPRLEPRVKNVLSACTAFCLPPSPFLPSFLPYSGIPGNTSSLSPIPSPPPPTTVSLSVETYISLPTFFLSPSYSLPATYIPAANQPSPLLYFVSFTSHTSWPDKVPRPDASVPPDVRVSLNQETATTMPRGKNCI